MTKRKQPVLPIFSNPVVQANCRGTDVYTYGHSNFLAASPDLVDDARVQSDNDAMLVKVPLRKSGKISYNLLGGTAPRMPRTSDNDYQPLEAIHLIDGDGQTCWCSQSQPQGDLQPAWIRLDLAMERPIRRIVLRKRVPQATRGVRGSQVLDHGAVEIGRAMPAMLTIRFCRDGKNWTTVFDGPSADTPDKHEFTLELPAAQIAKQIWILGNALPRVENWLHGFSIAEVAAYDESGRNVALVDRGTGVTVSSTQHGLGQTRDEHRWLWPIHEDLGLKFYRIGYHDDPVNWHWVEKKPGRLEMDPEADGAVTYLTERGLDTVLALGAGNRFHTQTDPARRLPQLWEWYYENPAPPTTPKAMAAWLRYVRFIVKHFRDRVKYFEIWNEWNVECYWGAPVSVEDYFAVVEATIPVIRKLAPRAKVMLGSPTGFVSGMSQWDPAQLARQEREHPLLLAIARFGREVDVVGFHPFYQRDPESPEWLSYAADLRALRAWAKSKDFRGQFMASEWTVGANYPDATEPNWWGSCNFSEMQKAKLVAHLSVLHTAMGVGSFFCETWSNTYPLDLTLLRRSFLSSPISPQQPQAAYYVVRNLATALDGLKPTKLDVKVTEANGMDHANPKLPARLGQRGGERLLTFAMSRRGETVIALWNQGRPSDACEGTPFDLELPGRFRSAVGCDPMNGTTQKLKITKTGKTTRIPGVLVRDYPVLIRLE